MAALPIFTRIRAWIRKKWKDDDSFWVQLAKTTLLDPPFTRQSARFAIRCSMLFLIVLVLQWIVLLFTVVLGKSATYYSKEMPAVGSEQIHWNAVTGDSSYGFGFHKFSWIWTLSFFGREVHHTMTRAKVKSALRSAPYVKRLEIPASAAVNDEKELFEMANDMNDQQRIDAFYDDSEDPMDDPLGGHSKSQQSSAYLDFMDYARVIERLQNFISDTMSQQDSHKGLSTEEQEAAVELARAKVAAVEAELEAEKHGVIPVVPNINSIGRVPNAGGVDQADDMNIIAPGIANSTSIGGVEEGVGKDDKGGEILSAAGDTMFGFGDLPAKPVEQADENNLVGSDESLNLQNTTSSSSGSASGSSGIKDDEEKPDGDIDAERAVAQEAEKEAEKEAGNEAAEGGSAAGKPMQDLISLITEDQQDSSVGSAGSGFGTASSGGSTFSGSAEIEGSNVEMVSGSRSDENGNAVNVDNVDGRMERSSKTSSDSSSASSIGGDGASVPIVYRLVVLTYNRPRSLQRLLDSLQGADYSGDLVTLDIFIDRPVDDVPDVETVQVAESFRWVHGNKQVHVRDHHGGLMQQWLFSWNESASDYAMILEDDLQVSPYFYVWWKAALSAYVDYSDIAGITLQRASVRADQRETKKPIHVPSDHWIFVYKLLGSWGFAPFPQFWTGFKSWYLETIHTNPSYHPFVPHLKMNEWYRKQMGKGTMWTMWFIRYCMDHHEPYFVYANLPERMTLASNYREDGLHYSKRGSGGIGGGSSLTRKADFGLYNVSVPDARLFEFPVRPLKLDWDGKRVE